MQSERKPFFDTVGWTRFLLLLHGHLLNPIWKSTDKRRAHRYDAFGRILTRYFRRNWLSAAAAIVLEGGVPRLAWASGRVLRPAPVRKAFERLTAVLGRLGVDTRAEALCQALLLGGGILFAVLLLLTGSPPLALVLLVAAGAFGYARLAARAEAQSADMLHALPDAIKALGIYYGAGMSMMQAFEQVAHETPEPLSGGFAAAAADMRAGRTAADALGALRARLGNDYADFVVVALEVHRLTGGSIRPLLDRAARGIAASFALERSLKVQTAQARLSARVVALMPVAVLAALALLNPSYLVSFLSSGIGLGLFVAACVLEVAGVVAVRRILAAATR